MRKPAIWIHGPVSFMIEFPVSDKKAAAGMPYYVSAIPLDSNGQKISKDQMMGNGSNQAYKIRIYGKNEHDILKNKFHQEAQKCIENLQAIGLLTKALDAPDFKALAESQEEAFFKKYQRERDWSSGTVSNYKSCYKYLTLELGGLVIDEMTQMDYDDLLARVCRTAAARSREKQDWQPGQRLCTAASTEQNLLNYLIEHLEDIGLCTAHFNLSSNKGQGSRAEDLLNRVDDARSIPKENMNALKCRFSLDDPIILEVDAGTRLSETLGLLWASLHRISAGLYYIEITGTLNDKSLRVETAKSDAAYRCVALSSEIGDALWKKRQSMEAAVGTDLSKRLMWGCVHNGKYHDDDTVMKKVKEHLTTDLEEFLRQNHILERTIRERAYTFDEARQNRRLSKMSTGHSLRRNFCTDQFSYSGLSESQIDEQIGHSVLESPGITRRGRKTDKELRIMCLKKQVTHTNFHDSQPLHYTAGGNYTKMEVSACGLELAIQKGQSIYLTIESQRMNNTLQLKLPDMLTADEATFIPLSGSWPIEDLIASDKMNEIVEVKDWPFE